MKSKKQVISAEQIGAVAMIAKLTRIWMPEGTPSKDIHASLNGNLYLQFAAYVGVETHLSYSEQGNRWVLSSTEPYPTHLNAEEPSPKSYGYMGCLIFDDDRNGIFIDNLPGDNPNPNWRSYHTRKEFTAKWLGFFRRNLWLCGCDIECTQHERMEWIQGWTVEEIEAWQLEI